jgi:hypothetical protein
VRAVAAVVVACIALAACGGGDAGVSEPAARLLHAQVTAVRTAAASRDRAGAAEQLASLRASLARLRKQGEINDDAATRIGRAVDAVSAQLTLIPLPTTTTTTTTTTIPPRAGKDHAERGPGHDKHHDKGQEPKHGPGPDGERH